MLDGYTISEQSRGVAAESKLRVLGRYFQASRAGEGEDAGSLDQARKEIFLDLAPAYAHALEHTLVCSHHIGRT